MADSDIRVRRLGRLDYAAALARMRAFTAARDAATPDELWLLEHPPVYTLGVRARRRSAPANGIPVTATDRGGDITYHGPGQPVLYLLLDLERRGLGIHVLVQLIEQAVIDLLAGFGIAAERRPGAPGVYVAARKIAALGLRVRAGRSYHGVALNARMDLAPFHAIDPCGYPGLEVAQIADWRPDIDPGEAGEGLLGQMLRLLGYTEGAAQAVTPGDRGPSDA